MNHDLQRKPILWLAVTVAAARELGQRLRGIRFAKVLTSPRQRAQRTCELTELSPTAQDEPDLPEWDHGEYEGQRLTPNQRAGERRAIERWENEGGEIPTNGAAVPV